MKNKKEKLKMYIRQHEKGDFTYADLEWKILNLFPIEYKLSQIELYTIPTKPNCEGNTVPVKQGVYARWDDIQEILRND